MTETVFVAADLEGTLTTGATYKGIASYLNAQGRGSAYKRMFRRHLPQAVLAKLGLVGKQDFRDRFMRSLLALLTGLQEAEVRAMAEHVVEHELWPNRRQRVVAELEAHIAAGRRVVLTSGTFQPVLEAFAARIGAEAVGTALELAEGRLTGRLSGTINTGGNKASQLEAYLGGAKLAAAYGDTLADGAMLALSAEPVAVCPDGALRRHAARQGWRLVEEG